MAIVRYPIRGEKYPRYYTDGPDGYVIPGSAIHRTDRVIAGGIWEDDDLARLVRFNSSRDSIGVVYRPAGVVV